MHRKLQYSRVKACHGLHGPYVMAYHGLLGPRDGLSRSSRSITVFAVIDAGTTFMSIASRLDQEPIVNGVKSKIRKKPAGKLSPCSEYDPASFQNSSEDQAIRMGPEHTICGIYQLFRKCSGGADGGVSAGSKVPSGRQCLDNLKVLCTSDQWLRVYRLWGAGRRIHRSVPSYREEGCRLGLPHPS